MIGERAVYKAFLYCVEMPEGKRKVDFKGRQASEGLRNTAVASQILHVRRIRPDLFAGYLRMDIDEAGEREE